MQGYGRKPPIGFIYPGSGRTADSRHPGSEPAANGHVPGTHQAAEPSEVLEDPDDEFPGSVGDLPHPTGAPRIINVGIGGPGRPLLMRLLLPDTAKCAGQRACPQLSLVEVAHRSTV